MNYEKLGERIRKQRHLLKWTQEQLAEKAGISLPFLGHIERGTRKASLETLVGICNALKVSPQLLLQDSLDEDLLDLDSRVSDGHRNLLREISDRISEYENSFPRFGKE